MSAVVAEVQGTTVTVNTVAGAAYVRKVTHPPTMIPSEYKGVPDASAPNVVRAEYKADENIGLDFVLSTATAINQTTRADKMLLLSMPGARVSNYVFLQSPESRTLAAGMVQPAPMLPASTLGQIGKPSVYNKGYNFSRSAEDMGALRNTYKSNTYYLNATDFSNQGTVTSCKFKPMILHSADNVTLDDWDPDVLKSFTKTLKTMGLRLCHKTKLLYKESEDILDVKQDKLKSIGTPYAFQLLGLGRDVDSTVSTIDNQYIINTDLVPSTASQVMAMSSKASTRPAKEGAFVVHQQAGPTSEWTNNAVHLRNVVPAGLVLSFMSIGSSGGGGYTIPLYATDNPRASSAIAPTLTGDMPWNNLDASWTIFEGLSINAAAEISPPYIVCKTFHGIEFQPNAAGSFLSMQDLLPMPDPRALEVVAGLFHARPDSLPAAANDLASIAATAVKYIPVAVSWLKDLFGKKPQMDQAMAAAQRFVAPKPPRQQRPRQPRQQPKREQRIEKKVDNLAQQVKRSVRITRAEEKQPSTLPRFENKPISYTPARSRSQPARQQRRRARSR